MSLRARRLLCLLWPGSISERCCRYEPKLKSENERIGDLLIGLTNAHRTWGFGRCYLHLRNVKGYLWNHKRV